MKAFTVLPGDSTHLPVISVDSDTKPGGGGMSAGSCWTVAGLWSVESGGAATVGVVPRLETW
jgi:hypothetical protein